MRRTLATVFVLGVACTANDPTLPAGKDPATTVTPGTTPDPPPQDHAEPAEPPPVTPPFAPAPPPQPTLQAGPDRYQLPATLRGECDGSGAMFCGAYIVDITAKRVTTLLSRDARTWSLRAGKRETPISVELVNMPEPPGSFHMAPQTGGESAVTRVEFSPPIPAVPKPLDLPGRIGLAYDVVIIGDKLYGLALLPEPGLAEVDLTAGKYRMLPVQGTVLQVHPFGERLVLHVDKGGTSIAVFDPTKGKVVTNIRLPRDLDPECRRKRYSLNEQVVVAVPHQDRVYVNFECLPE